MLWVMCRAVRACKMKQQHFSDGIYWAHAVGLMWCSIQGWAHGQFLKFDWGLIANSTRFLNLHCSTVYTSFACWSIPYLHRLFLYSLLHTGCQCLIICLFLDSSMMQDPRNSKHPRLIVSNGVPQAQRITESFACKLYHASNIKATASLLHC